MIKVALLGYKGAFSNAVGAGVNRYMYELSSNLTKYAPSKVGIDKREIEPTFLGLRPPFLPFYMNNLLESYSDYDIIHNSGGNMLSVPLKKTSTVYITTSFEFAASLHRNLVLEKYNDHVKNMGIGTYVHLLKMTEQLQLNSDHMITISTLTRDEAVSMGYERKNISVVNIGIDERFIKYKRSKKSDKLFRVGYVGSFLHKKNVIFAVRAFKLTDDKSMRMNIWGKKSKTFAYSHMAREAEEDKRISLMGFAPEEKLVETYDSFDVYVHPVLYTGFEMEIIEAQARGIPVIVCKKSEIPNEVRRYCLEAKDEADMAQIMKDIKDNGYNKKARRKAMRYARTFTWEKTAKETIKVYEKVKSS